MLLLLDFRFVHHYSFRKLIETEQIDVRLYSVIYKTIEEIKLAMEGMLSPDVEEKLFVILRLEKPLKYLRLELRRLYGFRW